MTSSDKRLLKYLTRRVKLEEYVPTESNAALEGDEWGDDGIRQKPTIRPPTLGGIDSDWDSDELQR